MTITFFKVSEINTKNRAKIDFLKFISILFIYREILKKFKIIILRLT